MRCGRGRSRVALFLLCFAAASASASRSGSAWAVTGDDLESARHLFKEAVGDENKGQYETALAKFRRVQNVKDTANVRYRIATCLEQLGQRASALSTYESAVQLGEGDKGSAEVVRASQEKVAQLNRVVARLTLVLSPRAPADADVRIDDARIAPAALAAPIAIDPGPHTISATAKDAVPFRTSVTLPEGGQASVQVPLDPQMPPVVDSHERAAVLNREDTASVEGASDPPSGTATAPGATRATRKIDRTAGIVTTAAGGVLLVAAGVTLVLRHGDISQLTSACPGGQCSAAQNEQRSQLTATRSRAVTETTLATVFGIAGAAATGVGLYLLVSAKPSSSTPSGSRAPARAAVGVGVAPVLATNGPAGAALTLTGAF